MQRFNKMATMATIKHTERESRSLMADVRWSTTGTRGGGGGGLCTATLPSFASFAVASVERWVVAEVSLVVLGGGGEDGAFLLCSSSSTTRSSSSSSLGCRCSSIRVRATTDVGVAGATGAASSFVARVATPSRSRASLSPLSLLSIAAFFAACFALSIRPNIFSCTNLVTSLLFSLPKVKLTSFARLFSAYSLRCSSLKSIPPNAPSLGVTINARIAVNAVRTDQLGCQCSSWYDVIDKQIFVNVSKRPFGVKSIKFGGLNG
jgi:hypothetical protein